MGEDFIDSAFYAVFLELEKGLPDIGLKQSSSTDISIGSSLFIPVKCFFIF